MPANYPGNATPATSTPWAAATHFALNSLIIPTAPHLTGYYYKATSVSGTATTGAVEPTYPTIIGATALNNKLDAFDAALNPSGADLATGLNTLGGLVYSCRIAGVPLRDPGDIDGQSLLIVDVEMVLP